MIAKKTPVHNYFMHYWEGGNSSLPNVPILFLHGWAISSEAYLPGLQLLAEKYRVIAPDLPGFGKSNHDTSMWSYEDYASSILAFIETLGIKRLHLIGQSMGGGIAIIMAALSPALVQSLILVDCVGIPLGDLNRLFLRRMIELPVQAWMAKFSHHKMMAQSFLYNALLRYNNVSATLRLPLSVDLSLYLSRIHAPCLVLWGEQDRTIPLAYGQKLAERISTSKLIIIDNAYHEWTLLMPEKFASVISEFTDQVEVAN